MLFGHLLLRLWLYLGESEWILRSLSVVFGVATVPAVYILGMRLFGPKAGLNKCDVAQPSYVSRPKLTGRPQLRFGHLIGSINLFLRPRP